jgi:hypothetical protein
VGSDRSGAAGRELGAGQSGSPRLSGGLPLEFQSMEEVSLLRIRGGLRQCRVAGLGADGGAGERRGWSWYSRSRQVWR